MDYRQKGANKVVGKRLQDGYETGCIVWLGDGSDKENIWGTASISKGENAEMVIGRI